MRVENMWVLLKLLLGNAAQGLVQIGDDANGMAILHC